VRPGPAAETVRARPNPLPDDICGTHSARSLSCRYLYLFNDILLCVDLEAITFWYPWRVDAVASLVGAKVSDCSAG
jgi:hypothetical protein